MKNYLTISALAVVGTCLALIASAGEERRKVGGFSSYDFQQGKRFDFNLYQDELALTPDWRPVDPFPPLSPRKAEESARILLNELVKSPERWSREAIALRPVGPAAKWVYIIHFSGFHPPGVQDGAVPQMRVVVLMNGHPVKPEVSPYPEKKTR